MGNIIFGYHDKKMKINNYECLVGGLLKRGELWHMSIRAVFSPIDVIEEYIRPRFVQNSSIVIKKLIKYRISRI